MIHDRWAVLFLHWRVPADVEATLEANTAPFVFERYDRSARIGLILLTEETVGTSFARTLWTCVTHHGINFRTNVRAEPKPKNTNKTSGKLAVRDASNYHPNTRGIHFLFLEREDEFTSWGANFFRMPYRVVEMKWSYENHDKSNKAQATPSNHGNYDYRIQSKHLSSSMPSIVRTIYYLNWWCPRVLHSTATNWKPASRSKINSSISTPSTSSQQFTVDCSWNRRSSHDKDTMCDTEPPHEDPGKDSFNIEPFDQWRTECYFINMHLRYSRNWREQVEHEPWPAEDYRTTRLERFPFLASIPTNMKGCGRSFDKWQITSSTWDLAGSL